MAASASKTGKVGFVGGMDIPLIRAFGCGYAQGARFVNPRVEIIQNMTGTTPAAWRDPTRGGELARAQFDRGVDIVYAAAGGTIVQTISDNMPLLALAGLLVGFGSTMGSGCTSGHGVCGLSRLSPRSLVATLAFMGAGFATVFVVRHVL
jgi:uncharacterized membrane protein YedE/YeeE